MDAALGHPARTSDRNIERIEVAFPTGATVARGTLNLPPRARGVVVLLGNERSSRLDAVPSLVAATLNRAGFAALTLDALDPCTENEIIGIIAWLRHHGSTAKLPVGLLSRRDSARAVASCALLLGLPSVRLSESETTERAAELAAQLFAGRLNRL